MRKWPDTAASEYDARALRSAEGGDDDAFDALLREAAHVSHAPARAPLQLALGSTLAGDRLQVLRCLGRGGMGIVYEVFDAERRCKVALKLLSRLGPEHIYRLKNEFRAIADLRHPNLVPLYELFAEGERWYYTMALVDGVPFDRYVRPDGVLDLARLRACLAQLVEAVATIHEAGKLHRDLKPSNVLVSEAGELTVLDFGLSVDAQIGGVGQTISEHAVCGTPAYMAPEQASGRRPVAASDLYAVGVMLFEALTGRLPFLGTTGEMIAAKQRDEPPRPSSIQPSLPADLDALCVSLLARDPAERARPRRATRTTSPPESRPTLYGRTSELAVLRAAYAAAKAGAAPVVRIVGESGIGKSALCEAFLEELRGEPDILLLTGRCYERESVPYKLFDPLIDALSRTLRRLPDAARQALVPRDASALCSLFPVLSRVSGFDVATTHARSDARERRQRAVPALFELLTHMRARGPLVIFVDDLQWADGDSLALLQELLGNRAGFPALLIASQRPAPEPATRLDAVFTAAHDHGAATLHTLVLGPLAHDATAALVCALACAGRVDEQAVEQLVHESGGHPLFAAELVHFMVQSRGLTNLTSLETALAHRFGALTPSARSLLELLALSAEPLLARVALQAASATHEDLERLIDARLVRTVRSHGVHGSGRTLECFHDRVREVVAVRLDEATRRRHAKRLADVLQTLDDASAELLRRCLFEAGEVTRAAELAADAAKAAERALAFARAAELYEQAITYCDPADHARRVALGTALGEALANAGRSVEAAASFRAAAALAPEPVATELSRQAVQHLLNSGVYTEGMALLHRLCDEAGVHLPRSMVVATGELSLMRMRLRLRGMGFRSTPRVPDPARLKTLATAVQGLTNYLPRHAAVMAHRYLIEALDSGDVMHAALAFGHCASIDARMSRHDPHVEAYLIRMREVAPAHPLLAAFEHLARGTWLNSCDAYGAAHAELTRVHELVEGVPGGVVLSDIAHVHLQYCAYARGDYAEIVRTTPQLVQQMLLHGRAFSGTTLTGGMGVLAWLVPDEPDAATRRIEEARRYLSTEPFTQQELLLMAGEIGVLIYRGEYHQAFELVSQRCAAFERACWTRSFSTSYGPMLRGGTAAALLPSATGSRRTLLRDTLRRSIRALQRSKLPCWEDRLAVFEAALALEHSDRAGAIAALKRRISPRRTGIPLAIMQRVIGALEGGDEGRARVAEANAAMRAQGVVNPEALTRHHVMGGLPV